MQNDNPGLPILEEPCDACGGTGDGPPGKPYEMRASLSCPKCKGHKVAPTEAGRRLLDFLKRRLNLSNPKRPALSSDERIYWQRRTPPVSVRPKPCRSQGHAREGARWPLFGQMNWRSMVG